MKSYHFVGIKGSGMSALAQILHDQGHRVQGADIAERLFTQTRLEDRNIPIYVFGESPLHPDLEVIASNAFSDDHPELIRCRDHRLPISRYHHFLGIWLRGYSSIAITGAHGKTTTTGLMAHVFSKIAPTSSLIGDGTGSGMPDSKYFVFEACEYRRHFLAYHPDIAVITNIDFDHPDYFSGIDDVRSAFQQMIDQVGRQIIACGDDDQVRLLRPRVPMLLYGFGSRNDLQARDIAVTPAGTSFDAYLRDRALGRFTIPMFGRHNVLNALAVIGTAFHSDLPMEEVREAMKTFGGVKRRFSEKPWIGNNILIDDYAHHPAEIRATIDAVRSKYPDRRIVSVFQPHTFSRLEQFLDDFAESLRGSDDVYLCGIFGSAREASGAIRIEQLQDRVPGAKLIGEDSVGQLLDYRDSVIVFMGAGDIQKYQRRLEQLV